MNPKTQEELEWLERDSKDPRYQTIRDGLETVLPYDLAEYAGKKISVTGYGRVHARHHLIGIHQIALAGQHFLDPSSPLGGDIDLGGFDAAIAGGESFRQRRLLKPQPDEDAASNRHRQDHRTGPPSFLVHSALAGNSAFSGAKKPSGAVAQCNLDHLK